MQVLLLGTFGEANESEMTAIRKIVCYSQFPGWGGALHTLQGPPGEAPGPVTG